MDLQLFAGRGKEIPKVVNGFDATIHAGKQGKHIPGHSNYQYGKSILTANAQKLLEKYAGKGEWIGQNKERVDFGEIIGKYVDPITGEAIETNKGIIHYSKNGAHIVPARP
ncbi:polymorphic toxin type 50 domain-containing protein [Paenibacillus larvae]|uniref:polymorphic toxin type 50 domain-containing protein n=1 Tax=Paenibacillus larvae TaxID=1464 RepID=UPI001F1C3215|nr:polymorphic toxin type 50 domain-containing protein [Paenibacillus larvae]